MELVKVAQLELFESDKFTHCPCNEPHRYSVAICNSCPYNVMLHGRNYFNAANCFCVAEGNNSFCQFCTYSKN